jgi:hypothetical protein
VYGEWHAPTHLDPVANVEYLIDGRVFHPGDAFSVPEEPVDTLLLPVNASWLKSIEMLAYAKQVGARQGFSIHDGLVNEIGLIVVDNVLGARDHCGRPAAGLRRVRRHLGRWSRPTSGPRVVSQLT